jgi:hypothetical protein
VLACELAKKIPTPRVIRAWGAIGGLYEGF